tara:strand:+ start:307 stop:447 length:141 start_codon:yes stop_codon:yes gene_type:complete
MFHSIDVAFGQPVDNKNTAASVAFLFNRNAFSGSYYVGTTQIAPFL